MTMTTSVLVPSFRRPDSLESCLRSLARQTVPPGEVLVVQQGDDTPTRDRAERLAAELPITVRVLHLGEPGIVPAENLALDHASGELILLIDDDAIAEPDWLERHLAHYADPTVGAVGGPADTYNPDGTRQEIRALGPQGRLTWFGRYIAHMHDLPPEWRSLPAKPVDHLVGYNMSLRRSAFDRFEERLRRYWQFFEADACFQVSGRGYRVLFDPGIVVEHRLTPRQSVYDPGRGGDLQIKLGNGAYNRTFVLSKHTRGPLRLVRRLYASLMGTTEAPGPLLLPRSIRRYGDARRELEVMRMVWAETRAGWRDGRRAASSRIVPGPDRGPIRGAALGAPKSKDLEPRGTP